MPPGRACLDDGAGQYALSRALESDIDEPRAGHFGCGNTGHAREVLRQRKSDLTRRQTGGLGQRQGHARGVVAVVTRLGALDLDLGHGL